MQKKSLLVFFCLLAVSIVPAQKSSVFNIPASIPVPSWVNKIDWDHPNVFAIESVISAYKAREKKLKRRDLNEDTKGNFKEENELDEEPYEVALRRWLNQNRPFIQRDGTIKVDKKYFKQLLNEAIQKQRLPRKSFVSRSGKVASTSAAAWSSIGPKRTYADNNQGLNNSQVNMYEIAISPSNPNVLYAGSETGILFKSVDKGLNWISINDGLPVIGEVSAIAVSPFNENEVFAFIGNNSGLIYSGDGGNTWMALNEFAGGYTNKIIINPVNSRMITASANGIYYSDDVIHYTRSNTIIGPGSEIYDVAFNPSDPSIVYAVSKSPDTLHPILLYRSTDGGINFTESTSLPNTDSIMGARLAVSPANSEYVYCISLHNDFPRLIKSTNSGQDWALTTTFTGTGLFGTNTTNGMSNGQGYYDLAIMVSPNNVNDLIIGTTSCWKSTDAGLNFDPIGGYAGIFPLHPDAQSMVAIGNDAYIATDGGINYSTDFFSDINNYSIRNNELTGSDYWGFGQGWSEDLVVGGRYHNGNAAIYENYGEGNSLIIGGGEDATGHVFQEPGQTRLTGFRDIGIRILPATFEGTLADGTFTNTKWPTDDNYGLFSSKLMIDPRYSNTFYVGRDSGFWKSENQGTSYKELKNFNAKVWRFDIARSNPDVIYLCTTAGINKTTDGGINWSPLSLPAGVEYFFYNTDITINPSNENEVWLCMAEGALSNKVFKSTDGGANWVNYTGTVLGNVEVSHVLAQGGTNGGVYAITNRGKARVYYRDATMDDWLDFSAGLPENFNAKLGGIIFYRDNKLRLAGNRGIWESPLYSSGTPVAQPMANKKYISCKEDTVIFGDYSMLEYAGASWQWSFPGASYVSSTTEREPKVTYPTVGSYSVTLIVTDAQARSSSKTVFEIIRFEGSNCDADTVAGKSISLHGENMPVNIGSANINSNNFSLSCWIKPAGNQKSFSQLISHDIYPGSASGFGLGFTFSGYAPNLHLCYTDNIVNYQNYSNLVADSAKWNNVVLTYSPAEVTIYLNGVAEIVNAGPDMPVIDLSRSPFYINKDILGQNGNYKGEIDEIKFYNYALSQNEVREKMHLIQSNGPAEQGLIKYVQFNKIDNEITYDIVNKNSIKIPDSISVNSTAPVGTGASYRVPFVYASGPFTLPGTGITLSWPEAGNYPDGELVGFKLNASPDSLANNFATFPNKNYFIINNYGANNNFTPLQKINFSNLLNSSNSFDASAFKLYKRPSTSDRKSDWINLGSANNYSPGSGNTASALEFSNNNISDFGQFYITNSTSSYNNNPNMNPSVGVGTKTPLGAALLDVTSTDKGFLPPRMSGMQRNAIKNPATGLMIWCTDCNELQVYNGIIWKSLSGGAADGSTSPNVRICNQVWMLKNLDVSNYRNGDPIPEVTDATSWANLTTGAWCWYNNDSATYAATYGKLYNWYAVNDPRGLAPVGWHIPAFSEWATLKDCIGGGATAGGKMKSVTGWIAPNFNATNSTGFTALPGGFCYVDGSFGENGIGSYFWSATDAGPENATGVDISNTTEFLNDYDYLKRDGFSIRCIKD